MTVSGRTFDRLKSELSDTLSSGLGGSGTGEKFVGGFVPSRVPQSLLRWSPVSSVDTVQPLPIKVSSTVVDRRTKHMWGHY